MSDAARASLLAQSNPSGTTAAQAYAAPANQKVEITLILIANVTSSVAHATLYHDDAGGSTFTDATTIYPAVEIAGNSTLAISPENVGVGIVLSPSGQLGFKTDTASAFTYSIYGVIQDRGPMR